MTGTRRDFFRGAAVALPASWMGFTKALAAAGPTLPDAANEPYWQMVKRQFPLEENLIYLNAANVCPASRPVMDRHLEFLRDFHANPSFQNRDKYAPLRETLRSKIAKMLRVTADEIAITRNTSEGSNIIVKGIDLKPGDEILVTSHNHPSNNESWKVRAKRDGLVVKTLPVPVPPRSAGELIAAFERALTPRTRVIAITHVTSTTGILYPAKEIADLARRRGIFLHLDGAQTFGALDVNLSEIGCDSYSASAHKWPMGPLEAGILYVRAERIPQVWPSIVTAGWSDNLKGARKFEVFGQRDDPRVVALEAAVDFVNLIGMTAVEARMRALATRAKLELQRIPAVQLKTNLEPELSAGVIKFSLKNVPTQRAYDELWRRRRLAIAMTASGDSEGLRFSPQIYNSMEEIDRAVAAVRELV
jgi:isopenicillin-N epimerase